MTPTTTKQKAPAPALEARKPGRMNGAMPTTPTTGIVSDAPLLVKVNLDNVAYSYKPTSEYGAIRNRMGKSAETVDARQLFRLVLRGHTFTPAAMDGTNGASWKEQRLFAVDIDNENMSTPLTVERAREIMAEAGIVPLFAYNTFSHSQAVPRFRMVFASDETVTDKAEAQRITEGLQSLFPGADKSGKDAARMFLGTNKGAAIPYTGLTNPVSRLLELYHEPPGQTAVKPHSGEDSALAQAIDDFDMGAYVARTECVQGKWAKDGRRQFNPCPICGHNDDFYTLGCTWKCFGANNPSGIAGGNILNYLEARHGYDRKTAREHFMYNILGWNREETRKQTREFERVKRAEQAVGAAAITNKDERPDFIRVKKRKDPETGELVEAESVSCPRLAQYIIEHEHFRFVKVPGAKSPLRFWYRDGVYQEVFEDEIMGAICELIDAWNPDILKQRDVEEVYKTIKRKCSLKCVSVNDKDAEEFVVNFRNGLYFPLTNEFKPHTPDLFLTRQLPFDFPLETMESGFCIEDKIQTFQRFMARFCNGSDGKHPDGVNRWTCICEYMALILSNVSSTHFKKSLWMYGDGNSGKSQLLALMKYMLGDYAYQTDLEQLEARFGAGPVYNKRLVYCPDQKFIKVKELGVFKTLVGAGDGINVERKGQDSFTYDFDGYVWLGMNRLPKFGGDDGVHVFDRMILFKVPPTIPESERDGSMLAKMKAEAPYIAAYVLTFLSYVYQDGEWNLTEPAETVKARKEYAFENDPIRQWLSECCVDTENPGEDVETVEAWRKNPNKPIISTLYNIYCEWCKAYENGYKLKRNDWKLKLKEIAGNPNMPDDDFFVSVKRHGSGKVAARWCLNDEALKQYAIYL